MRWQLDAHDVAPATCTLQVDCAWLFASSIFPFPLSLSLSGCTTLSAVVLQVGFTTLAVELGVYVRRTRKAPPGRSDDGDATAPLPAPWNKAYAAGELGFDHTESSWLRRALHRGNVSKSFSAKTRQPNAQCICAARIAGVASIWVHFSFIVWNRPASSI